MWFITIDVGLRWPQADPLAEGTKTSSKSTILVDPKEGAQELEKPARALGG
jgi:hypothetical protein